MESQFISNPRSKESLDSMLGKIFEGLNQRGECILSVDSANAINLKVFPDAIAPIPVLDHQVPIIIRELDGTVAESNVIISPQHPQRDPISTPRLRPLKCFICAVLVGVWFTVNVTSDWDLGLQECMPFIDGRRHIKRIAREANMDVEIVRNCVRQLIYYRCVQLIDIFQVLPNVLTWRVIWVISSVPISFVLLFFHVTKIAMLFCAGVNIHHISLCGHLYMCVYDSVFQHVLLHHSFGHVVSKFAFATRVLGLYCLAWCKWSSNICKSVCSVFTAGTPPTIW